MNRTTQRILATFWHLLPVLAWALQLQALILGGVALVALAYIKVFKFRQKRKDLLELGAELGAVEKKIAFWQRLTFLPEAPQQLARG